MRKAVLTILASAGVLWGLADTADAFCHKVRTTCIARYPGLYSFAPCGFGYSPYVYPCAYCFPKYIGHRRSCWRGYLTCASRYPFGSGCGAAGSCGYGYGCDGCDGAWDGCGAGGCYGGCGGCDGCYGGGCDGCYGCGGGCDGCYGGCGGCDGCYGGCAGGYPATSDAAGEGEGETIYDGPAPEPAENPEPVDADPMASNQQVGFRRVAHTRRDGTPAFARGLESYRDGNMSAALREFDSAAAAEPENALYRYYQALARYTLDGADSARQWLHQAVETERQSPVKNWGRRMERVQGRARLWIEQARSSAGLGR